MGSYHPEFEPVELNVLSCSYVAPITMEFKDVLKSHIGRGWEQVASSMNMLTRVEIDQLVTRHDKDLYCQIDEFLAHPLQFPRLPTKEETASLLVEIIEKASLPETARSVCHALAAFLQVGVDGTYCCL